MRKHLALVALLLTQQAQKLLNLVLAWHSWMHEKKSEQAGYELGLGLPAEEMPQ